MYRAPELAWKYLKYRLQSSNGKGHGMHSPYGYKLIREVLMDRNEYPEYQKIEELRQELLKNRSVLTIEDFGAGSAINSSNQRTVGSLAKNAAKSPKYAELLFRLIRYIEPENMLELGTSLGISASYIASANPAGKLITLEGSNEIADCAELNFKKLGLNNVLLRRGPFERTLDAAINELNRIDFAFIDGNHRLAPTVEYFQKIIAHTNQDSFVILDDIHWSKEMEEAWDVCRTNKEVTLSIDLFFIGIVFFKKSIKEQQHFTIRF